MRWSLLGGSGSLGVGLGVLQLHATSCSQSTCFLTGGAIFGCCLQTISPMMDCTSNCEPDFVQKLCVVISPSPLYLRTFAMSFILGKYAHVYIHLVFSLPTLQLDKSCIPDVIFGSEPGTWFILQIFILLTFLCWFQRKSLNLVIGLWHETLACRAGMPFLI